LVGAAYAADELENFEKWLLGLGLPDVLSFMDVRLNGGMIKGERLMEFFRKSFIDRPIENLAMPFAAVATALHNGAEVWLREGRTLVDGALVNPVPVSLARAMGADIVIAVDLGSDLLGRHMREESESEAPAAEISEWRRKLQENLSAFIPTNPDDESRLPSMIDVVTSSINIMQVRISRSRMAGDPPDAIVAPRLGHLSLLDFHRAKEAIEEGERAVENALPSLKALFSHSQ
jgi:NTE family protein